MKKILSIISICCMINAIHAENSYYYYRGERVPLTISQDSIIVYSANENKTGSYTSYVAENKDFETRNGTITSLERIIVGNDGTLIKMNNRFYVQLFDSADIWKLERIARETNSIIHGQVQNMPDWYVLFVHNSIIDNSLEMSNYFYETGLFKDVDPGFIFHFTPSCVSLDSFANQWALPAIKACQAWDITKGSSQVKIAIVDDGISRDHPEFSFEKFTDFYICATGSYSIYDMYGDHGTQVCGVIASQHNKGHIAGMAPKVKIIPINYYSASDTASESIATGISWAISHGADVINCSWGDHHNSQIYDRLHSDLLEDAIYNAFTNGRSGKGCVVVFAAGNQGISSLDYPANKFPEILTVGAMDSDSTRWVSALGSSNYGDSLDVVAPGANILTTYLPSYTGENYITTSGTSVAAPYVSSIAALMLSINPYLTRKEVTDIIESTAVKVNNYPYTGPTIDHPNGRWNIEMGYGLVDAYAAVEEAKNRLIQGPEYVCDTAKYYFINAPENATFSWSIDNGSLSYPQYSIIGSSTLDTVLVKCTYVNIRGNSEDENYTSDLIGPEVPFPNLTKSLSVIVTNNGTSETYTRILIHSDSEVPTISASSTHTLWLSQTSRTFTVTNCIGVPDSLLQWTVIRKGTTPPPPIQPTLNTYNYYGRTLTYSPPTPPSISRPDTLTIYATNLAGVCGSVNSDTLRFVVIPKKILLNGNVDGQQLDITIMEDSEDSQRLMAQLDEDSNYSLELWHSIYGAMRIQTADNAHEQMNISGLPQGIYVLSLKENGIIIAQTKIQIE